MAASVAAQAGIDCAPSCDFCWVGTPFENDCDPAWQGDGACDCGCQFADPDCVPCPGGCPDPTGPCDAGQESNTSTGLCEDLPDAPEGSPCEADKNLCTLEQCDGAGDCVLFDIVPCEEPTSECDSGQACDPDTGTCYDVEDPPFSTPCEADLSLCTLDHCDGLGNCVTFDEVDCVMSSGPCDGGEVCNADTGLCEDVADPPPGSICENDGDPCTIEQCDEFGDCVSVGPLDCSHLNTDCADGVCNSATGMCESIPKPLSTPCQADKSLCTIDHCDGQGNCVFLEGVDCPGPTDCDGGQVCNPATGVCEDLADPPLSTPCDLDSDLCKVDHCDGMGNCVFLNDVDCPGPIPPCEGGTQCNPATGLCDPFPDAPLSTPCEADSDACTQDHCDGFGQCVFLAQLCGACCDRTDANDPVCTDTTAALCTCPACVFTEGATCAEVPCDVIFVPVPTVSEWGLVVLALLLLTGGKVYFARREQLGA